MIKITFEINEDFISENADVNKVIKRVKDKNDVLKCVTDVICFTKLDEQVKKGNTEFVVNKDDLDNTSKILYDSTISRVCVLAAFSETDKVQNKE